MQFYVRIKCSQNLYNQNFLIKIFLCIKYVTIYRDYYIFIIKFDEQIYSLWILKKNYTKEHRKVSIKMFGKLTKILLITKLFEKTL